MAKKYRQFQQGIYTPINKHKYVGVSLPKYRSSYELKFFRFLDNNVNVIMWGSESLSIPYVSPIDNRVHHYYPDNIVKIKEGNKTTTYIIEIKPSTQTKPPSTFNRKSQRKLIYEQVQYAVNTAKWAAAASWCKTNGMVFQLITENELKI